ncbi:MAG: PHP domain-containing protein [Thermoplasmata archaeon]
MKVDFHVHSKYSPDSSTEPKDLIKYAKKIGLAGFAITDHNSFGAYETVKDEKEIMIIPGIEVSTLSGHVIGLWVKGNIPKDMSVEETIIKIHESGGIAVAVHPYRYITGLKEKNVRANKFDLIEIMNGRCLTHNNKRSEILAKSLNLPVSAGSDAHYLEELGRVYLELENLSIEGMLKNANHADGSSRDIKGTIKYSGKVVKEWIHRDFKRI